MGEKTIFNFENRGGTKVYMENIANSASIHELITNLKELEEPINPKEKEELITALNRINKSNKKYFIIGIAITIISIIIGILGFIL